MSSSSTSASETTSTTFVTSTPSADKWTPATYTSRFVEERTRPGLELLQRAQYALQLQKSSSVNLVKCVYDLGTGTGRFIPHLLAAFTSITHLYATDVSDKMLQEAKKYVSSEIPEASQRDKIHFVKQDIAAFEPIIDDHSSGVEGIDLIYSNAALQWLPNQFDVLTRLMSKVRIGGVVAIQLPNDFDRPSHTEMISVLSEMEAANRLEAGTAQRLKLSLPNVDSRGLLAYHALLRPLCSHLDVFDTIYYQNATCPLSTERAVTHPVSHFLQGSSLAHLLHDLPHDKHSEFLLSYAKRLHLHYPCWAATNERGIEETCCVFPFSRWFIVAVKK